jgi:hypothetical protein
MCSARQHLVVAAMFAAGSLHAASGVLHLSATAVGARVIRRYYTEEQRCDAVVCDLLCRPITALRANAAREHGTTSSPCVLRSAVCIWLT